MNEQLAIKLPNTGIKKIKRRNFMRDLKTIFGKEI